MIENKFPPIQTPPLSGEVLSEKTVLSPIDILKSFKQNIQPLQTSTMPDEITKAMLCQTNCSGNGECRDGSCYCMIRYDGDDCRHINFSYHVAFASIFFLLALTSLIQLAMCIHAEYLRMKKHPSILRACRITTQKFLYFAVFLAALLRGTYFAAPTVGSEWSTSLLSAYYPVVLTSASLVVCFWAEVFHLREVRWDRPRFLSKSFLGFVAFNVISYAILIAELLMVWLPTSTEEDGLTEEMEKMKGDDRREFYAHIFNGNLSFFVMQDVCCSSFELFSHDHEPPPVEKIQGMPYQVSRRIFECRCIIRHFMYGTRQQQPSQPKEEIDVGDVLSSEV